MTTAARLRYARYVRSTAVLALLLAPAELFAQGASTGAIAGMARDSTGAVLPGVTVEVSSPALIEKTRVAVTNATGQYLVVALPPGVYRVTFTLPGFSTVKQEGLELVAGFTATVNGELKVGALEETITVSGESPVVDTRNTTQLRTVGRTLIEALPAQKNFSAMAALIPGVSITAGGASRGQDVGGSTGERVPRVLIHGSTDSIMLFNGMRSGNAGGGGSSAGPWVANAGMIEEFSIETGGTSAEWAESGVRVNPIPKSGGNQFSGWFNVAYMNEHMQSSNLDDALRARGVSGEFKTRKIYDYNPAAGGPITRDKLWFYASWRSWGTDVVPPGAFHAKDPTAPIFVKDLSRPIVTHIGYYSTAARLTWQPVQKHGFTFYADHVPVNWNATDASSSTSFEATNRHWMPRESLIQGTWKWTLSNRWLIETGNTFKVEYEKYKPWPSTSPDLSRVFDQGTGFATRASNLYMDGFMNSGNGRGSMTYVTGGHAVKVGTEWLYGTIDYRRSLINDSTYNLLNEVPVSVTRWATPTRTVTKARLQGFFAQDQWTHKRVTANVGLRFDWLNSHIPAYTQPAVRYAPAVEIPRIENLPNYMDISPRFGVSYDLFGNGRTALKASLGRYLQPMADQIARLVHPQQFLTEALGTSDTRAWTDRNGDFFPQEDELGPSSNAKFGTNELTVRLDSAIANGWGLRQHNWDTMIGLQHELFPGTSVDVSYHRRVGRNFLVRRNLAVTPSDFSPFCVTAPTDARLPGGGGYEVCGLYNVAPEKFGQQDNVIMLDKQFGKVTNIFDGVDLVANARLPRSVLLQGGVSIGRGAGTYISPTVSSDNVSGSAINRCFVVDTPQELLDCDVTPPFQANIKFLAVYPLPWWGLETSVTVQSLPGPEIQANWSAPASAVTGLGRPLAGSARSVTVPLIKPGTVYGERLNQVDLRFGTNLVVGRVRIKGMFDLYNLLNSNAVLAQNNTFGRAWLNAISVLPGRIAKVGATVSF
jgi:hypothetical protein